MEISQMMEVSLRYLEVLGRSRPLIPALSRQIKSMRLSWKIQKTDDAFGSWKY